MFHRAILGWLAAIGMGHFAAGLCVGQPPAVNLGGAEPQESAPSSLDSCRQRVEWLLPQNWSVKAGRDDLIVALDGTVLVGTNRVSGHRPPDPPAVTIDGKIYLPGKGDPKKTVYINEPVYTPTGYSLRGVPPEPYHLFEPRPGQSAPKTRNDVVFGHRRYTITIRFLPLVGDEEYQRLIDGNKSTMAKIKKTRKALVSRGLFGKGDEFIPNTPTDRKLISELEQLKKTIRPLPRFHTADQTVDIEDFLDGNGRIFFADEQIGKEARSIRTEVERMFTPYPLPD